MNKLIFISALWIVAWTGFVSHASDQPRELNDAVFAQLHQQVRPSPDELWRSIPWKLSVVEAQRIATKEGKPIFIWAMDGHPLGCT